MKNILLIITSILTFSSSIASAEIITINFRGTVSTVSGNTSIANIGNIVEGSYSYDDTVPNTSTDPLNYAEYRLPSPVPDNLGFTSLSINGASLVRAPDISHSNVFIANDMEDWNNPSQTIDDIGMDTCCDIGTINGQLINHAILQFNDNLNNPITSNNISGIEASLNNFSNKKIYIGTVDEFGSWISIEVDLEPVSINAPLEPLPPAKIVNIYFKGMITSVNGDSTIASVGNIIEGTYSYDESTRNTSHDPDNFAEYKAADPVPDNLGFTRLSINGASLVRSPVINNAIVFIGNDITDWSDPTKMIDDVGMDMCCEVGTINGTTISHAFLQFNDNMTNPLQTNNLTEVAGALNRFSTRKIYIGAQDNLGNWVNIEALLEPVSTTEPLNNGNDNVVAFRSIVRTVDDPTGQLAGSINNGDTINGNWRFSPSLVDSNPDPEIAEYAPVDSQGQVGNGDNNNYLAFDVNGYSFKGNVDTAFNIKIENGSKDSPTGLWPDNFRVSAFSHLGTLSNGSYLDNFHVHLSSNGDSINTTELNEATPSSLDDWFSADFMMYGRHPDGSRFTITATVVALSRGSETVPTTVNQIFPASGTIYGINNFDANLKLEVTSETPFVNGSLANLNGPSLQIDCQIDASNEGNAFIRCPNIGRYFTPGDNLLRILINDHNVIKVKTATYHWIP